MTQTHAAHGLRTTSVTFPPGSVLLSETPGSGGGPLRLGVTGLTTVDRDQAAELADVLNTFARTGRLPAPDPQPPVSPEMRQYTEVYHRFGRGAGYATAG